MLKPSTIGSIWLLAAGIAANGQILLLDRAVAAPGVRLGTADSHIFLTDDLEVGAPGEDWVIDRLRVWAVADSSAPFPQLPGNLYESITLRGGLSSAATAKDECDCHGLLNLKTATLKAGSTVTSNRDVAISAVKYGDGSDFQEFGHPASLWQIDFQNLLWSVPGASRVQFGMVASGKQNSATRSKYTWFMHGSSAPDSASHQLRVYSTDGKIQGDTVPNPARMNVQVWGHMLASISIRQAGKTIEVTLKSVPGLDTAQVDPSSLQFGPRHVAPSATTPTRDSDGKAVLLATFPAAGIPPGSVNACLTGQRADGVPFEGCDLVPTNQPR